MKLKDFHKFWSKGAGEKAIGQYEWCLPEQNCAVMMLEFLGGCCQDVAMQCNAKVLTLKSVIFLSLNMAQVPPSINVSLCDFLLPILLLKR